MTDKFSMRGAEIASAIVFNKSESIKILFSGVLSSCDMLAKKF
jgi:hypothetical protein